MDATTNLKVAKLIMVTANNNNKFYEMREQDNGTFTVVYGRVGTSGASTSYPMRLWDRKKREKIRKGYTDQTHLFAESREAEPGPVFTDIDEAAVQRLVQQLMRYANKSISQNYTVTADQVTEAQVTEAQAILDGLVKLVKIGMNVTMFNGILLELYQVIPRKMGQVRDHLATVPSTKDDLTKINEKLAEEQATLDVMRGQVSINSQQKEQPKKEQEKINLLEAMGLQITEVKNAAITLKIKNLMGSDASKFARAYEVKNITTQVDFDELIAQKTNQKTELFWHGSRNENWLSILKGGLVLRPANAVITGKMFGYGLYFADKFRKSLNYTSLRGSYWANGRHDQGFLALYDVHVGEQYHIQKHESWCYELTEPKLKELGKNYDSLFAEGGADLVNNEYIVYNQAQCTVRYLVEVR